MSDTDAPMRRSAVVKEFLRVLRGLDLLRPDQPSLYTVRRGAIDWSSWAWPTPRAIALRVPENFPRISGDISSSSTITCIVGCRIPSGNEEIDDSTLDELESDVLTAADALRRVTINGSSDNLVLDLSWQGSVEWYDVSLRAQGYHIAFTVKY